MSTVQLQAEHIGRMQRKRFMPLVSLRGPHYTKDACTTAARVVLDGRRDETLVVAVTLRVRFGLADPVRSPRPTASCVPMMHFDAGTAYSHRGHSRRCWLAQLWPCA